MTTPPERTEKTDWTEAQARQARLEDVARRGWSAQDPDAVVASVLHADGKVDLTVISRLFEGRDAREREAFFWPVFAPVPRADLLYMTYCLLLTPGEAARNFATPGPPAGEDNHDDWA